MILDEKFPLAACLAQQPVHYNKHNDRTEASSSPLFGSKTCNNSFS